MVRMSRAGKPVTQLTRVNEICWTACARDVEICATRRHEDSGMVAAARVRSEQTPSDDHEIHGGPHGGQRRFQFHVQAFAANGYVVLYTNPRHRLRLRVRNAMGDYPGGLLAT